MTWSASISIFLILLVAWVFTFPLDAVRLIVEIKRQFRQSLIEKYGKKEAKKLAQQLIRKARQQDIPVSIAKEIILKHQEEIIHRLGNHIMEDLLND